MTDRITPERQKEFMARTLVGMVLYNKREFTDEECAVYNSILALLDQHQPAPTLMDLRGIAPDATGDLSSEEFVRRVREGWTPPNSAMPATPDMERVKQLMVLVAHWTIWVDRTKCRWDENDQKAFKEVLDILWAQRPKPAPTGNTCHTIWTRARLEKLTDFWNEIWNRLHPAEMDPDGFSPREERCWGDLLDILNDWGDRLQHPPTFPAPTDEERREMVEWLDDALGRDDKWFRKQCPTNPTTIGEMVTKDGKAQMFEAPATGKTGEEMYQAVRALLQSQPKVSVTRAQVEQFVPCICIDAYKDRGLAQPDCPRCSLVDMDGLLAYLNYGIAFGEAREAVDSEEGKEEE